LASLNIDSTTPALIAHTPAIRHSQEARPLRQSVSGLANLMAKYHRWLLLVAPLYTIAMGGQAVWRQTVLLAAVILIYNGAISAAEEHWADWARSRAVQLRCGEIALVFLALVWLPVEGLNSHLYLASIYGLLVSLAAMSIGRESVTWTATSAALAVAAYLPIVAYGDPVLVAIVGAASWPAVVLYAVSLWLIYLGVGLVSATLGDAGLTGSLEKVKRHSSVDHEHEAEGHRDRLATMGETTAQVLHGLSNPLTGITTIVDDLLEDCDDATRQSLQLMKGEAERASALVRELLCFTRRDTINPVVSVNEIADRAMNLFSMRTRPDDIRIAYHLSPSPTTVRAGEHRLEQVILNLLDNARHAINGRTQGTITLKTSVSDTHVVLEVSDNGEGMSPDVRKRVLEPFFTTKAPGIGTGLGLAIVAGIVRDSGGEIAVESTAGSGSTFTISLPKVS